MFVLRPHDGLLSVEAALVLRGHPPALPTPSLSCDGSGQVLPFPVDNGAKKEEAMIPIVMPSLLPGADRHETTHSSHPRKARGPETPAHHRARCPETATLAGSLSSRLSRPAPACQWRACSG